MRKPRIDNRIEFSFVHARKDKWITETMELSARVLELLSITNWEVSVVFCDDAFIRELNGKYRKKDSPTDVLAFRQAESVPFPKHDGLEYAGDIVISIDTLKRNADTLRVDKRMELLRLLVHAILHLYGLDHTVRDRSMIELQEEIIRTIREETA